MGEDRKIIGHIDSMSDGIMSGWAFKIGTNEPLRLQLFIDGMPITRFYCDGDRPDVLTDGLDIAALCGHAPRVGFVIKIPNQFCDGLEHQVQVRSDDDMPAWLHTRDGTTVDCLTWIFSERNSKSSDGRGLLPQSRGIGNDLHEENDNKTAELPEGDDAKGVYSIHGVPYGDDQAVMIQILSPECWIIFPRFVSDWHLLCHSDGVRGRDVAWSWHLVDLSSHLYHDGRFAHSTASSGIWEQNASAKNISSEDAGDTRLDIAGDFVVRQSGKIGLRALMVLRQPDRGHTPLKPTDPEVTRILRQYFDPEFYLTNNADVAADGIDAYTHFIALGYCERRSPNRWFDMAYYLDSNPEFLDADINPFWHFIMIGESEGRQPSKRGDYKRHIIHSLIDVDRRTAILSSQFSASKTLYEYLNATLKAAMSHFKGMVFSFSHDLYIENTGGIQIFICDEQKAFMKQGVAYFHISPLLSELKLASSGSNKLLNLTLNGTHLAISTYDELIRICSELDAYFPRERLFIVHCLLGHEPEQLTILRNIIHPQHSLFWLHDFSSVCEGYTLLRNGVSYCGAPPTGSMGCRVCIHGNGRDRQAPRIREFFANADFIVVAPSRSALQIWLNATTLPHRSTEVHPHCVLQETAQRVSLATAPARGSQANPVRVAFVGYPEPHKGWPLFANLVERVGRDKRFDFYHFTSGGDPPAIVDVTRVWAHTTMSDRSAMIRALSSHMIDVVVMLNPWPETFSYVTHEALAAGADIITLAASGNIADIVTTMKRGLILSNDMALFELFESGLLIGYIQMRYEQGMRAGHLVHCGTSATLNLLSVEADAVF